MNALTAIVPNHKLSIPEFREWILEVENKMVNSGRSVDRHSEAGGFHLEHVFTPGLYTREISMPAGALVVSKIHLYEHPFVITKGKVSIYDGDSILTVEAPYRAVTKAGTKRILYVHEDTVWTTFHITDKTSFEEVDVNGVITCDTFKEFEHLVNREIPICHG